MARWHCEASYAESSRFLHGTVMSATCFVKRGRPQSRPMSFLATPKAKRATLSCSATGKWHRTRPAGTLQRVHRRGKGLAMFSFSPEAQGTPLSRLAARQARRRSAAPPNGLFTGASSDAILVASSRSPALWNGICPRAERPVGASKRHHPLNPAEREPRRRTTFDH